MQERLRVLTFSSAIFLVGLGNPLLAESTSGEGETMAAEELRGEESDDSAVLGETTMTPVFPEDEGGELGGATELDAPELLSEPVGIDESLDTTSSARLTLGEVEYYQDPKRYTATLSGGSAWFDSGNMATTFEPFSPTFRLQFGRVLVEQFQLQLDLGLTKDEGYLSSSSDSTEVSGDTATLKLIPAALGITYRADYAFEQPLVPYLSAGVEGAYVDVTDVATLSTDEVDEVVGHRLGWYVGGGLEFLLDSLEPARAADLEVSSGINDTYLVLDVRYHWLRWYAEDFRMVEDTSDPQAVFDGFQFTAGLKFDF